MDLIRTVWVWALFCSYTRSLAHPFGACANYSGALSRQIASAFVIVCFQNGADPIDMDL